MSRFLSILCAAIFVIWLFTFDREAYEEMQAQQRESEGVDRKAEPVKPTAEPKMPLLFPLPKKSLEDVVSGYGDTRAGGKRLHEGIDIPAERGTPVVAVADGEVVRVAHKGGGGKQVWLQVGSRQYFYAHLDSWEVREGQRVRRGDVIGTVGNTGNASHTMPHLHFGVYVDRHETIDPAELYK